MYLVLCTSDYEGWPARRDEAAFPSCRRIPFNRRATVIYEELEDAEREAERLALQNPGERFSVFERRAEVKRAVRESSLGVLTVIDRWPSHHQGGAPK